MSSTLSNAAWLKAKSLLEQHEGYRQFPYRDKTGRLTIGIGRNLQDNGLSFEEAEYLLEKDILHIEAELKRHLPIYESLNDVRKIALINMCFNLGIDGLMQFRLFLNALTKGDYDTAAKEMLNSRWAIQVGNRAHTLAYMIEAGIDGAKGIACD